MAYSNEASCDDALKEVNIRTAKYTKEPHFLQIDRRMKETTNEIEYMTKMLESKKTYLKQLEAVRKMVKPADEAKIQALISVGLL